MNNVFKKGFAGFPFCIIIMYKRMCNHQQNVTINKRNPKTNFKT